MSTPDLDGRLARVETELAQQRTLLVAVRGIVERLTMQQTQVTATLALHGEHLAHLAQTLAVITELLQRRNGREEVP